MNGINNTNGTNELNKENFYVLPKKKHKSNNNEQNYINKELIDLETDFYWLNMGNKYPVNPKLKYCIFFNGCCCPPHIGHINSIKEIFSVFGPDCKVIINHIGSSKRHGVPSKYSSYLFKKYINDIFKNNYDIEYLFRAKNRQIIYHPYTINSNVFVIVRGDELDNEYLVKQNYKELVTKINKKNIQRFGKYVEILNSKNIKLDFYMQIRDVNTISATKFMESLDNYKLKKKLQIHNSTDFFKILDFIPEEIDYKTKCIIAKKLLSFETYSHFENYSNFEEKDDSKK
jgi:hypothetical protein